MSWIRFGTSNQKSEDAMDNVEAKNCDFYKRLDAFMNREWIVCVNKCVSENEDGFKASIKEFPVISAFGATAQKSYDNALFELRNIAARIILTSLTEGKDSKNKE